MSACKCEERKRPVTERNWAVVDRKMVYRSPNGYGHRYMSSDYSTITFHSCGNFWRTKSNYVDLLKSGKHK
ncbi:MAG: hypothetical protein OEL54_05285, partial [Flavobacteriaceae bacterium]|nr:hypothetical protein [Flavobacteriaceae bacterium]